jgi:hypothetical protein
VWLIVTFGSQYSTFHVDNKNQSHEDDGLWGQRDKVIVIQPQFMVSITVQDKRKSGRLIHSTSLQILLFLTSHRPGAGKAGTTTVCQCRLVGHNFDKHRKF